MNKLIVLSLLFESFFIYTIYAQTFCRNIDCGTSTLRTIDGSCNNRNVPWMGAAGVPYKRLLSPAYNDNSGSLKIKGKSGKLLPTPRDISLNVHFPREGNGSMSLFAVLCGQVIAHDVSSGTSQKDSNGKSVDCSADQKNNNPVCINLPTLKRDSVNQDQPIFEISRTAATNKDFNCNSAVREQVNAATSYLDLSVIYGSTDDMAKKVRTFANGLLATSSIQNLFTSRDFLPSQSVGGCVHETANTPCFRSGEFRVNENLVLTSIQVLLVREHNRIAGILKSKRKDATDEDLFQNARRLLNGIYHHIIYFEYLPVIIGNDLMDRNGLTVTDFSNFNPSSFRTPYDENVLAQTSNEFMGAAFRFGHSMLQSSYVKKDRNFTPIKTLDLNEITFNPTEAYTDAGCDGFLRGALTEPSSIFDPHISNTPENHLFDIIPDIPVKRGSLSTLSIQRGRDHAFQPYVKYREFCGLSVPKSFEELDMPSDSIAALKNTYESVEDIELYSGGLSENPSPGATVGPLFACIIAKQFSDWKKGDRFFYENDFNVNELAEIKKASIGRLVCDNIGVASIPSKSFLPPGSSNPLVECSTFPSIDFSKFAAVGTTKGTTRVTTRVTTRGTTRVTTRRTTNRNSVDDRFDFDKFFKGLLN